MSRRRAKKRARLARQLARAHPIAPPVPVPVALSVALSVPLAGAGRFRNAAPAAAALVLSGWGCLRGLAAPALSRYPSAAAPWALVTWQSGERSSMAASWEFYYPSREAALRAAKPHPTITGQTVDGQPFCVVDVTRTAGKRPSIEEALRIGRPMSPCAPERENLDPGQLGGTYDGYRKTAVRKTFYK